MTGEEKMQVSPLSALLNRAEDMLRALLAGEKPLLDPDGSYPDRLLVSLLEDMDAAHDLDSPAEFYYLTQQDVLNGRHIDKLRINTQVHPLNIDLIAEAEEIIGGLDGQGIKNAQVLGADFFSEHRADNFILSSRGALPALGQALALINEALAGNQSRSLIVDNSNGRWTPFLEMTGLADESVAKALNVHVVRHKADIAAVLKTAGREPAKQIPAARKLFNSGQRPYLAFDTSSVIKSTDAVNVIKKNGYNAFLVHSNVVGGHSSKGLEFAGSYGGNTLDKLVTTLRYKATLAPGTLEQDLDGRGESVENTFLVVADSGISFCNEELFAQPEFNGVRDLVVPGAPVPGPETKPVLVRLGSTDDLYRTIEKAIRRAGDKKDVRVCTDTCVWLIAPLQQNDPDNPVYFAIKSARRSIIAPEPKPPGAVNRTGKHYQMPAGADQTLAELEAAKNPFAWQETSFASSLHALLRQCGAGQRAPAVKPTFNIAAKNYTVLANHHMDAQEDRAELEALDEALRQVGMKLAENVVVPRSLQDVRDLIFQNDGYVIMPGRKEMDFYLNGLFQTSLLAGKQLKDRHLDNKYIEHLRRVEMDRGTVTQILDHMKAAGMIADHFDFYFRERTAIPDLVASFANAARKYQRYPYIPQQPRVILPDTGRDNVTFFLSASTDIPEFLDDAWAASYNFARNGFGILSGMGRHAMMGVNVYAPLLLKAQGHDVQVAGVQDPYAMITEGWPIEFMRKLMGPQHAQVANDIFERIQVLTEADQIKDTERRKLIVVQGGGIGTLQELFAVLWMKQVTPGLENMHVIIQNRKRLFSDGTVQGVYDKFLEHVSPEYMRKLNIHVCETVEQTLAFASEITGRALTWHDVPRPVGGYPFEKEKNPRIADLRL